MSASNPIRFVEIALRANLRSLVENACGQPNRSRKYVCPFHDDHDPSLSISPDGHRFKCWSSACGVSGTALDWVMLRDRIDVVEAAKLLDPSIADDDRSRKPATKPEPAAKTLRKLSKAAAWESAEWQAEADAIIRRAEACLWSAEGVDALAWLRSRGLARDTVSRFRLGFLPGPMKSEPIEVLGPGDDGATRRIHAPRGIIIPWIAPESWYAGKGEDSPRWVGANVRRLALDPFDSLPNNVPKCQAFAGSERGHGYPWADLPPSSNPVPAIVVEGEIDALLAWQDAGPIAYSVTVGGASQRPHRSAMVALAACPWVLIGTDRDEAGVQAARSWREKLPHKTKRLALPFGKDLGEFIQGGGDIASWLRDEFRRFGLLWPLDPPPAIQPAAPIVTPEPIAPADPLPVAGVLVETPAIVEVAEPPEPECEPDPISQRIAPEPSPWPWRDVINRMGASRLFQWSYRTIAFERGGMPRGAAEQTAFAEIAS